MTEPSGGGHGRDVGGAVLIEGGEEHDGAAPVEDCGGDDGVG